MLKLEYQFVYLPLNPRTSYWYDFCHHLACSRLENFPSCLSLELCALSGISKKSEKRMFSCFFKVWPSWIDSCVFWNRSCDQISLDIPYSEMMYQFHVLLSYNYINYLFAESIVAVAALIYLCSFVNSSNVSLQIAILTKFISAVIALKFFAKFMHDLRTFFQVYRDDLLSV